MKAKFLPIMILIMFTLFYYGNFDHILIANKVKCQSDSVELTDDPVIIYKVSTLVTLDTQKRAGSLEGGTTLYIQASGLDQFPSNNQVKIGDYPCYIPDKGVYGTYLKCDTMKPNGDKLTNLLVTIQVVGKKISTCPTNDCTFSYTSAQTPVITQLLTRTAYPREITQWRGRFVNTKLDDIKDMKIGDLRCDRFDIITESDFINTGEDFIQCQLSKIQEAGYFRISALTVAGFAQKGQRIPQVSVLKTDEEKKQLVYDILVVPIIEELSSNIVSPQGQILVIKGMGFTKNTEVYAMGQKTELLSVIQNEIKVLVPKFSADFSAPLPYVTGAGLRYTRYSDGGFGNCEGFKKKMLSPLSYVVQEDTIRGEPVSADNYGTNYGQFFRGYFKAPKTGNYRFFQYSDDCSAIWINPTKNVVDPANLQKITDLGDYCSEFDPYQRYLEKNTYKPISDPISLEANQYYYMEMYQINGGGPGYFGAGVIIPNSDGVKPNSFVEIQEVKISSTPIREQIEYSVYNTDDNILLEGTYQIKFTFDERDLKNGFKISGALKVTATDQEVQQAMKQCGYSSTSVQKIPVSSTGTEVSSDQPTAGYKYKITFNALRSTDPEKRILPTFIAKFTKGTPNTLKAQKNVEPSSQNSGTFVLSWNSVDLEANSQTAIPYNGADTHIKTALENLKDTKGNKLFNGVTTWKFGDCNENCRYYIQFNGYPGDIPELVVKTNGLNGPSVQLTVTEYIKGSNDQLYFPIPGELLYSPALKPQVNVLSDGIMAICPQGICNYEIVTDQTPTLSSYTYNDGNGLLTMIIEDTRQTKYTSDDLSISFCGNECTSITLTATVNQVTCTISTKLEAGSHIPKIQINKIGFSRIASSIQPKEVPLTITSISPSSGSIGGGTELTITGTGFPNSNIGDLELKVDNQYIENFTSFSNTEIKFKTPPQGSIPENPTITLTFNDKTATSKAFTYSLTQTVKITKLTDDAAGTQQITSQSPLKRKDIYVHGQNFGSDINKIRVELVQTESDAAKKKQKPRVYDLYIASSSDVTDTKIKVRISGGRVGDYDLRVYREGFGYSLNESGDNYSLKIVVTEVSPNIGSAAGGTKLTIKGENFSPDNIVVFIGNAVNWMCNILTATETTITCLTPEKNDLDEYNSTDGVDIIVTANLREESVTECASGKKCTFYYDKTKTPKQILPQGAIQEDLVDTQAYEPVYHERRRLLPNSIEKYVLYQLELHRRFLYESHTMKNDINHLKHAFSNRRQLISLLAQDRTVPQYYVTYKKGDSVTITGSVFGNQPSIQIGEFALIEDPTITTDSLTFQFPSVPQGRHRLIVINKEYGYAEGIWNANVDLTILSISPVKGSLGGQKLIISGGGFNLPSEDPEDQVARPPPTVTVGDQPCLEIEYIDHETISCITPRFISGGMKAVKVSQKDPLKQFVTNTITGPNFNAVSSAPIPNINSINQQLFTNTDEILITVGGTNTIPEQDKPITVELIAQLTREKISGTVTKIPSGNTLSIEMKFTLVPAGTYTLNIIYGGETYAFFGDTKKQEIVISMPTTSSVKSTSSIIGGAELVINGKGLSSIKENNNVKVCGFKCDITSAAYSQLKCLTPTFLSQNSQIEYGIEPYGPKIDLNQFTISGDSTTKSIFQNLFDGLQTTFYTSTNKNCFFQIDFGIEKKLKMKQFRFFPKIQQNPNIFQGSTFEYTLDGNTWTILKTIDSSVHSGWNFYVFEEPIVGITKFRFQGTDESDCAISELEIKGWLLYPTNPDLSSVKCGVIVSVNGQSNSEQAEVVEYRKDKTPVVNSLDTITGPTNGGTQLTFSGTGFSTNKGENQVLIDELPCVIQSSTATEIVCLTGNKDVQSPKVKENSMQILVNNQKAAIKSDIFFYANPWSDPQTWGGDAPPRDGDTIQVPSDQILLVDVQKTPRLFAVFVEGQLIFKDGIDQEFYSNFILVRMGKITIGTEQNRRKSKLLIELSGNIYDKQLPEFGNKFIGCHHCTLDIHGQEIEHTWSMMDETAEIGATSIKMIHNLKDWKIGDEIVISSTDWNHINAERRIIKSITENSGKSIITFDEPLVHRHYSAVETYGNEKFPMRCEVGLLTRNIHIRGNPEDSTTSQYGAHLMIHGKQSGGVIGRISYTEFSNVGQPQILGRYPIHFHLNGEIFESYSKGNAVHDSHARCITVHGVHYLRVQKNVCYNTMGHTIFLEDGIETNNIFEDNLVLGSKQSWIMLQTDITTSSYWFTNPYNYVRNNYQAGSEWYGFWYEIKVNPDGPSATSDICPPGMELLDFSNNVAHSNGRYGLRILEMSARKYPCLPTRNDDYNIEKFSDPFEENPAILIEFKNFTTFKNNEDGVLGEVLGYVKFTDFKVADSKLAGFQTHKCNLTREGATIENWLIVGVSQGNPNSEDYYDQTRAIIAPRTDGLHVKNVRLYNFKSNMILLQSCSVCFSPKLWVTGSKNTWFQEIKTVNSDEAQVIFWENHRREIFWDLDGSISGIQKPAYIVPYKAHLEGLCTNKLEAKWNNSMICEESKVIIRDFLLNNPMPYQDFEGLNMKVLRLGPGVDRKTAPASSFNEEWMVKIKKSNDIKQSFATPLAVGYTYNIHWRYGLNFKHLAIQPSPYLTDQIPGYVIQFNYTDNREYFDILRLEAGQLNFKNGKPRLNYSELQQQLEPLNPENCLNGDWYNDQNEEIVQICFSGKNKKEFEYVDINPIPCRRFCPDPFAEGEKETFYRKWSNVTQWKEIGFPDKPDGNTPIIIPYPWNLILDEDPPILTNLTLMGDLYFDQSREVNNLRAMVIWIRGGKLIAGQKESPFLKKINIELIGNFEDPYLLIDPYIEASNKVIAVTSQLELYGKAPSVVWTRLAEFAEAGQSTIKLIQKVEWRKDEEIVIGPSGQDPSQHERFFIKDIDEAGTTITLDKPLAYDHYGDPDITIKNGDAVLDMRAGVGLLSRNITIKGNEDNGNKWGCHVLVYQFQDKKLDAEGNSVTKTRRGWAYLEGVEFQNCGQYDTEKAGLNFQLLNNETFINNASTVTGCSFHDSEGFLFNSDRSYNIKVDNNVFYNGMKVLAQMIDGKKNYFRNNLLILVKKRKGMAEIGIHDWSAWGQFSGYEEIPDQKRDNIEIAHNVGQGSEDSGFFFHPIGCGEVAKVGTYNNTGSACILAAISYKEVPGSCSLIKWAYAFHSNRGIMATLNTQETKIENIILVENKINLVIKPGLHDNYDNPQDHQNWYISALARPNCPKCYKKSFGSICSNNYAYQMYTISSSAKRPVVAKPSNAYDSICTIQKIDGRAYIINTIFENFKFDYASFGAGFEACKNNNVMIQHGGAPDMTSSHYFTNVQCKNCDKSQLFQFRDSNPGLLGWFGGCGSFLCTGDKNILVQDNDGKFLGQVGQVFSNNSYIGPNMTTECTRVKEWNGYECPGQRFAVLNWMSIAPDYNKRLFSPVSITSEGSSFFNHINSLKEWSWDGPEPLNLRESKFIGIVPLNSVLNMTNAGQNPSDAQFWIQKRTRAGNDDDWVIIKLFYQTPHAIQVLAQTQENPDGKIIKPYVQKKDGSWEDLKSHVGECGANNYFFENNTIHFVVNGYNCLVRVRQINSVFITARLEIDYDKFFDDGKDISFMQKVIAFLDIDPSKIKIVGHKKGSTILITSLEADSSTSSSAEQNTKDQEQLTGLATKLSGGMTTDSTLTEFNGQVTEIKPMIMPDLSTIKSSEAPYIKNTTTTPTGKDATITEKKSDESSDKDNTVAIAVGVTFGIVGLMMIIVGVVCYAKHNNKKKHNHDKVAVEDPSIFNKTLESSNIQFKK